jgi:tagaturonate reductase
MNLSRYTLKNLNGERVQLPGEPLLELPEKVLQFGTGVLLRGLPDFFIDKANQAGCFNGRVVMVKSTRQGDAGAFDRQDGLYTLCTRGVEMGKMVEENRVNASISRVLSAADEWEKVLECAHNQQLQIIISNTTEVGIQMVPDDIRHHPPKSFPGKLLAFLYERYRAFNGSAQCGMVIVPTELIPDNGRKLEAIVLELAHLNSLEEGFIEWIEAHNTFCNSLVDRIVPGTPEPVTLKRIESELGYRDALLTMTESYRLWAIEGDERVRSVLSFADADEGVVITEDIGLFRELKLRLLNATHTFSCGLAYLAGCETVHRAMEDEAVSTFIRELMQCEIAPAIPMAVPQELAQQFSVKVLDRFRNPHIHHPWLNITVQYSSKMRMRCIPLILQHYTSSDQVPARFALGFAAYLFFMKAVRQNEGSYYGLYNETSYLIQDEEAAVYYRRWTGLSTAALVEEVLRDQAYWGADLQALPGFQLAVTDCLNSLLQNGMRDALDSFTLKAAVA